MRVISMKSDTPARAQGVLSVAKICAVALSLAATDSLGRQSQWSVGTVVGSGTGISVLFKPHVNQGIHMMGRVDAASSMSFELNNQIYFKPAEIINTGLDLFTGYGLQGNAKRQDDLRETYELAIPVGMEWRWRQFPLTIFADETALIGNLPSTNLTLRFEIGLRALL